MGIFAISALINAIVATALGLFVISYNPKSKINKLYFLLGLAVAFWSVAYWQWQLSTTAKTALFWVRILSIGSTFIPVFYFHWVTALLEREKKLKNFIYITYAIAIIITLFSFSPFVVRGVGPKMFFPFWPDPGILYHIYLAYVYCFLVAYSMFLLVKDYLNSHGEKKIQIIYVIIGSAVGFGGGLFNFFLWYDIPIPPYGNFLVAFYPFLLGYAVIKYRLFDVKIAATEILVFLLWIVLLVKALLSKTPQDLFINGGIVIAAAIIGTLLVRGILRDVKQKERIEKMAKDISQAYEVEKKAKEELQLLDKSKTQFMLVTQHHLRTPLTSVMGYLDLVLSEKYGKIPKKAKEMLQKAERANASEIKIVNDLLSVSQFQLGKTGMQLEPGINIKKIFDEIISEVKFQADQKNLELKVEGKVPSIKADKSKLKVALANVIDNAVKYTAKGGIFIKLKTENTKIIIAIKDTGIGMSKEELDNVFSKTFERGTDAQKINAVGKGIGLFLTAKIIEAHKGKIWAESEGQGKGSTFIIEMPA